MKSKQKLTGDIESRLGKVEARLESVEKRMATKDDLRQLEERIDKKSEDRFEKQERLLEKALRLQEERIKFYFDAAVENIEDSLRGANKDEISALRDADKRLKQRVEALERHTGLPPV